MPARNKLTPTAITDEPLLARVEHLASVNRDLQADYERHFASEAAWREERALLVAMLNQVPDYLFAKDTEGRFLMANRAVALDLGRERGDDLVGLTDYEMQNDPEVAKKFREDDQAVLLSGKARLDIEEFLLDSNGGKQWLSTSKVPLRNDAGDVIGLLGVARNVTERKRAQDQVEFLAFHDTLTGLPNRLLFERRLNEAIDLAGDTPEAALLYLDIDRFKNINDTLGHAAGDELIRQVGARLSAAARGGDTVARLGGDEFAVVMANASSKSAEALSQRILRELGRPFELLQSQVFVGISIGIAMTGGVRVDGNEMLRRADIALYRAKAHGRGRFETFAESMAVAIVESQQIEHDLREALSTQSGLHALYQPVFEAKSLKLAGAESLVRWNHPTRGLLGPQTFIGVAEERGLIEPLSEIVLRQACAQANTAGLPWVAVNVAPVQFRNARFAELVLNIVAESGLTPQRLQLEITEGALLENTDAVQASLGELRQRGVTIALDDFGTGYSSMNYLRNYNVDKLKIDRSFVAQLGGTDSTGAIIAAIIGLARAMELKVTAEGVETMAQRDALIAMGCDEVQGYLLGRPMPGVALGALGR